MVYKNHRTRKESVCGEQHIRCLPEEGDSEYVVTVCRMADLLLEAVRYAIKAQTQSGSCPLGTFELGWEGQNATARAVALVRPHHLRVVVGSRLYRELADASASLAEAFRTTTPA